MGKLINIERIFRILVGLGLLGYFAYNPSAYWALLGLVPLGTGVFNFCPLYLLRRGPARADGEPSTPRGHTGEEALAEEDRTAAASAEGEGEAEAREEASNPGSRRGPRPGRPGAKGGPRAYTRKQRMAGRVAPDRVIHATDASFNELVRSTDLPVLVDFWAEWCGPCKAIAPVLDELAREQAGAARILKVNVDDNPGTAGRFGIRSIPTLALLKDGEVMDVLVGAQSKAKLEKLLRKHASRQAA